MPTSINRAISKVASFTALSRLLGLIREILTSRLMGSGIEQSAFVFAFTIPNLFRKLFGEGALSSAFVPVFKSHIESKRLLEAEQLAKAVMSMLFCLLGAICAIAMLGITCVLPFLDVNSKTALTLQLTRMMLPYAVMICIAACGMGVLNVVGKFGRAAFAPALLNIVWILTLVTIAFFPNLPTQQRIDYVSFSVLLSGLLQMGYMLWEIRKHGFKLSLTGQGWRDDSVKTVWKNTFVGAIGMGAIQINLVLDNALALWAAPWAPAAIAYAERLVYLPLGIIATSFATVLLPTLAGSFAQNDVTNAKQTLCSAAQNVIILTLPAAIGLALVAHDATAIVYQGGKFTATDTLHVSRALLCYAPGLLLFSLHKIFVPWFHAQQDMKTPLKVGLWMVALNACLNVVFVLTLPHGWKHAGIAGSTVLCSLGSSLLLVNKAHQKGGAFGLRTILRPIIQSLLASLVMAVLVILIQHLIRIHIESPLRASWLVLFTAIPAGGVTYLFLSPLSAKILRFKTKRIK